MKTEFIKSIRDGLGIMLNHLILVAGAITVSDLFQVDNPNILLWVLLVIVPLGICYITKKVPKIIPPPIFIFLLEIMSLAEKIMKTQDWSSYYYIITFVYLIGFFLYYFTKRFVDFLKLNQNTASNIPTVHMFKNGIGLTVFFSACSCLILLVTANVEWVRAIADKIWGVILIILRYIFSGIDTPPPLAEKEEFTQDDPQMGGANMSELIPEQTLEGIRNLIIVLFCITLVIGIMLFLYYIYFVIKEMEGASPEKKIKGKKDEEGDIREFCGIEKKSGRKVGGFLFQTNREKIRRIYQKRVLKRKKDLIGEQEQQQLKYLTAKECCDKLAEQQLRMVYEKARYSEETISAEDVKLAK